MGRIAMKTFKQQLPFYCNTGEVEEDPDVLIAAETGKLLVGLLQFTTKSTFAPTNYYICTRISLNSSSWHGVAYLKLKLILCNCH